MSRVPAHPRGALRAAPLILSLSLLTLRVPAQKLDCDVSGYRPLPGLEASVERDSLEVAWSGADGVSFKLELGIEGGTPIVRSIGWRGKDGWTTLARGLRPELVVTTGVRRSGHGLPEESRWDVYWDAPLTVPGPPEGNPNLPRKPEEVRRSKASFQAAACRVSTDGARLETEFPGVFLGIFSGALRFTVYRGASLLRMEAIARTDEPSAAFKYAAGLTGFSSDDFPRLHWRDVGGSPQVRELGGSVHQDPVPLRARNRLLLLEGRNGSIACFPPPHQFFFPRQLEVNLGYVWYRKDAGGSFSAGVRQGESHEGYNPVWIERVFPLYNAPPGSLQRMAVYFLLSPGGPLACRESALALTHGDRFQPLPGWKTLATHFHTAFTQELLQAGSLDLEPPWIPTLRAAGVDIVFLCDFHGDGHPDDPGPIRLKELETYFEACRRHSDRTFLIVPGEEPNAFLGGHYNILFPRPVLWTRVRPEGAPLVEEQPARGKVYHTGSAADVLEMLRREGGLVWQTHPRTKGSTFYPDRIRDTDYFQSDRWLGAGFKAMPADLSRPRLGDPRCFAVLDDMNNWAGPKCLIGEVDTYKKFPEYDIYGDFNVNYVRLEEVPRVDDLSAIVRALRAGDFFVTTGEVLIRSFTVERTGGEVQVAAELEWTFPLEFTEVVWGDGQSVDRRVASATDRPPFGAERFRFSLDAAGKKWVRFAAWDSAGNGAFTQPVHLKPR